MCRSAGDDLHSACTVNLGCCKQVIGLFTVPESPRNTETSRGPAGGPAGHESAAILHVEWHLSCHRKIPCPHLANAGCDRVPGLTCSSQVADTTLQRNNSKKGPARLFWSTFQPWPLVPVLQITRRSDSPGVTVKLFPLF